MASIVGVRWSISVVMLRAHAFKPAWSHRCLLSTSVVLMFCSNVVAIAAQNAKTVLEQSPDLTASPTTPGRDTTGLRCKTRRREGGALQAVVSGRRAML